MAQARRAETGDPRAPLTLSIDARTAAEDCAEMSEVRQGIDALDRALVALIAERTRYMDAAARIKTERDRVRDPARIEDVVAKVKAEAARLGAPTDLVEPVWRELIERSIAYELVAWDDLRKDSIDKR